MNVFSFNSHVTKGTASSDNYSQVLRVYETYELVHDLSVYCCNSCRSC